MTSSHGNISALLAICAGNSPVAGEFPAQRSVTLSFDVFFDLRLNKLLSKQSCGWWCETPSRSLWRHYNETKAEWIRLLTQQSRENSPPFCRWYIQIHFLCDNLDSNITNICFVPHWNQVMHICLSKLSIIGSDNGWASVGILLIEP